MLCLAWTLVNCLLVADRLIAQSILDTRKQFNSISERITLAYYYPEIFAGLDYHHTDHWSMYKYLWVTFDYISNIQLLM